MENWLLLVHTRVSIFKALVSLSRESRMRRGATTIPKYRVVVWVEEFLYYSHDKMAVKSCLIFPCERRSLSLPNIVVCDFEFQTLKAKLRTVKIAQRKDLLTKFMIILTLTFYKIVSEASYNCCQTRYLFSQISHTTSCAEQFWPFSNVSSVSKMMWKLPLLTPNSWRGKLRARFLTRTSALHLLFFQVLSSILALLF